MQRMFVTALIVVSLSGCHGPQSDASWLGAPRPVEAPAGPGSVFPNLAATADGQPVMSWMEPASDGTVTLRYAKWSGNGWSAPRTVAAGSEWFVNWADFPSVVPAGGTLWGAHWLEQLPGNAYAYGVRISVSADGGQTWSAPMSPHDDGTATQHGFVSLYGYDGHLGAAWLDGRHTGGGGEHADGDGAMTLRSATIGSDGKRLGPDLEIDARTCDCCQTDAAMTSDGPVIVYRDRDQDGTRDIVIARLGPGGWSPPARVSHDHWKIDACPVNGPAVDAIGDRVVVAWFTAADVPRVRLAYSSDGGRSFATPMEVASGRLAGRVDVVLLADGRAVVSWLDEAGEFAEIRARPYTPSGAAGPAVVVARGEIARSSGFPRMARAGDGLVFAWTRSGATPAVRTAFATLR
jgi:hypothetical protein